VQVPWVVPVEFRLNFSAVDEIPLPAWGYEPTDMPPVAWHGVADELGDGGQKNSQALGYGPGFDADPVASNLTSWDEVRNRRNQQNSHSFPIPPPKDQLKQDGPRAAIGKA
jgi:hypothetical protein